MAKVYYIGSANVIYWFDQLSFTPQQEQSFSMMKLPAPSTIDISGEDPWYWSTERVVKELCTADRSWQPRGTLTELPATIGLEAKLRHEGIDGCILLNDITDAFMKEDLGLTKLAWRVFVKGAYEQLRLRSDQYKQHKLLQHGGSHFPSHTFSIAPAGHQHLQTDHVPPTPPPQTQHYSPVRSNCAAVGSSLDLPPDEGLELSLDSRSARGEFVVFDDLGNKRRKLDLTNAASNLALPDEDEVLFEAQQLEHAETAQAEITDPAPAPEKPDVNGKKRKRIAPTLISSELDPNRDREIPTAADDVVRNDPKSIEPGVVFMGDDGKKRLVPIHQKDGDSNKIYDYQALLQKSKTSSAQVLEHGGAEYLYAAHHTNNVDGKESTQSPDSQAVGYLGKKKLTVDDVFYAATPVGQELPLGPEPADFSIGPTSISNGRRIYMHRVIKRYLNSEPIVLLRDGKRFSASRPYPSRLTPRYSSPSFTLFFETEDGKIHARREELRLWPEIDPDARFQKEVDVEVNIVTVNTSMPSILGAIGLHDPLDPDLLEKYKHVEGGDEVLPLYGESDEENEYDLETWREIEEEQGNIEKPLRKLAKPALNLEEVYEAIDEGIADIVLKWKKNKLPKKQMKAYSIWKKFRPISLRAKRLMKRRLGVEHMNKRIAKLRKEIAEEIWTSKAKVRMQSHVLEPSIHDREEWAWEIRIIESKEPPEKLPSYQASFDHPLKRSSRRVDDGEEGDIISDRSEASDSYDDLNDFIVNDSPVSEEDKELSLADGEEDEDGPLSDVNVLEISKLPTARKLIFKRSSNCASSVDDNNDHDGDLPMPEAPEDPFLSVSGKRSPGAQVKQEGQTLPKCPAATSSNASITKMIDLTLSSDEVSGNEVIDLVTPRKTMIKLVNRNSPVTISDSDSATQVPDPKDIPALQNAAAIAKYSHQVWVKLADRERLVVSVLFGMPVRMRNSIFTLISDTETKLWHTMVDVMDAIRKDGDSVKGMDDATFENFCILMRLFMIFHFCKYYPFRQRPRKSEVSGIRYEDEQFHDFHKFCRKIEGYFDSQMPLSAQSTCQKPAASPNDDDYDDDDDDGPSTGRRSRFAAINTSDDEDGEEDKQCKIKRKKKFRENTEAKALREQDRERQAAQEERRRKLLANLVKSGDHGVGSQIIINDSKSDEEGFIYVNQKIARRIKEHQRDGVRFMWNQIVAGDAKQGCLLAHTMGLGKTMQVITLLVAIAEASQSTDESIYSQIPIELRQSKTLVLCPPGLIDNWMDELLIWAPKDILGNLRKIDATIKFNNRWDAIDNWYSDGGVLVIGYEMFRNIINNKRRANQDEPRIDEKRHAQVKMQLTEGPNIIVADEAHKLKNAASDLSLASGLFRSGSRIALTGSPLANNVAEYHTMIEWVAPNYLGPAEEFRAKYVDPIEAGLYFDSSVPERRRSLRMLGVLKEDLSPKVHRADMSVLRNDLPLKKEFVIKVPLTDLQRKAYCIYVKYMLSKVALTKDGGIPQTTLWSWLAVLSLLCNHPYPFMMKLVEREAEFKNGGSSNPASRDSTDLDDIGIDLNSLAWKLGDTESLVDQEQRLFTEESDMKSVSLSCKTQILCQILDASKATGDRVLVFSQSIPTLDFLEEICRNQCRKYARLDGKTAINKRQKQTKDFNTGSLELYLISTTAGGLGLNLYGANRVVIFDFKFNPILEEQAVGRAYRIGQQKEVFVYRFVAGGTFEDLIHNKAIFKKQLASRVVDKKNPIARATKKSKDFLFEPTDVPQEDLSKLQGEDPDVLDNILASQTHNSTICDVIQTTNFEKDDDDDLTPEELKQVKQMLEDEKLKRANPQAYRALMEQRNRSATVPHHPIKGVTERSNLSSSTPMWRHNPNHNQAMQKSSGDPIHPPIYESFPTSQNTTAVPPPRTSAQASSDRVPRPRLSVATGPGPDAVSPKNTPSSGANVALVSTSSMVTSSDRRPDAHPPGGSSPVLGAGTKMGSETSRSVSPATINTPRNASLKVTANVSNKANKSTGSDVEARSGHPSESLNKGGTQKMDEIAESEKDKVCVPNAPSHLFSSQPRTFQNGRKARTELKEPLGHQNRSISYAGSALAPSSELAARRNEENQDIAIKNQSIMSNNTRQASTLKPEQVATERVEISSSPGDSSASSSESPPKKGLIRQKLDDIPSVDSEMYRAMNRRPPVQSLRSPVTNHSSKRAQISTPQAADDARVMQLVREKRAQRTVNQTTMNGTTASSTSSVHSTAKSGRLPRWAVENIKEAKHGKRRTDRDSSASSRTTAPKE